MAHGVASAASAAVSHILLVLGIALGVAIIVAIDGPAIRRNVPDLLPWPSPENLLTGWSVVPLVD